MAKRSKGAASEGEAATSVAGRKAKREDERAQRLALVLALEIRRMVEDVLLRKGLLVEIWSKMRARRPLLNVLRSRYEDVPAVDLVELPADAILRVEAFYRVVDEFRLYLESTEDMPNTLENHYANYASQMEQAGLVALGLLQDLHGRNLNLSAGGALKGGELLEIAPFFDEGGA